MNRHQKQKSREIKDIMRTDVWRKMSYKEAKRKWKAGIRAFPIGPNQTWLTFYLARLGFDRERLRELGQAVYMLISYASGKGMELTVEYWPSTDSYYLKFRGKDISGKPFGTAIFVTASLLRQCAGPLQDIVRHVVRYTDREIEALGVTPMPKGFTTYVKVPFPKDAVLEPCVGDFIGRRKV